MLVLHPTYQTNQPIKVGVVPNHSTNLVDSNAIRILGFYSWLNVCLGTKFSSGVPLVWLTLSCQYRKVLVFFYA